MKWTARLAALGPSQPARHRALGGAAQGLMSAAAALIAYLPTKPLGLQEGFWGSITAIAVVQGGLSATQASARDQVIGAAIGGLYGAAAVEIELSNPLLAGSARGIMVSPMSLTLYYHPLSSFCHKVLIALYENDVEFERRVIDFGNPAERSELQGIWPMCKFPVVRDHARKRDLPESSIIIEYLDHFYGGGHRMIPGEWEDALDTRLWDRFCDQYVHLPMQHIVADRIGGSKGDMAKERATLATAYAVLERRMTSRIWLAGKAFGLADCAAAAALFYANCVQPFPAELAHVHAYFDRLTQRPSVARVLEESKPYFAMFPFAEGLPQRYRA